MADSYNSTNPSRRAIIAAMPAAAIAGAALAIPAVAAAAIDPVFPALVRQQAAWDEFGRYCGAVDEVAAEQDGYEITDADRAAYETASDAETAACDALCATPPTTLAGLRAAIEWMLHYDRGFLPDATDAFLVTLLSSPLLAV
jgi:hypothetical protein